MSSNSRLAESSPEQKSHKLALFLLMLVYGFNFIDRQIVGILAPYIQADLSLTNTQLGLLMGFVFAAFYTIMGIPIAYIADKYNRVTLVAVSLGLWSAFTAVTGFAQNFVQIGLARMGVGIGEAGGSPPSHSIISDLYPKHRRSAALGVYSLGIPLGIMSAYFAAALLMGSDANTVNWRRIFIVLGVVGILLAFVVKWLIDEPTRGASDTQKVKHSSPKNTKTNSNKQADIRTLLRTKSWWFMALGISFGSLAAYSFTGFQTKFLRLLNPDYPFREVLWWLGVINGLAYAVGTYGGAKLADHWGTKNIRAYSYLPCLAIIIALPCCLAALWVESVAIHLIFTCVILTALGSYLAPSFAIAQTLSPINTRSLSTALFFFILNMIGLGCGPTITGMLIDAFSTNHTPLFATRWALSVVCFSFVIGLLYFYLVSKYIQADWKAAELRNHSENIK